MCQTEDVEVCVHHEIIEPAHGSPTVKGVCRKCGAVKVYQAGLTFTAFEGALRPSDPTIPY